MSIEMEIDYKKITQDVDQALDDLFKVADLKRNQIMVIGCSTSEVGGSRIGSHSSIEIAQAIMEGLNPRIKKQGLYLAIQCCEHLNRAIVVEEACMKEYRLDEVMVYPIQGAGGSLAHLAMNTFENPVVVERIQGHAGLDIGDTFIGMHLKPVVVPVRSEISKIGHAHLSMARTRPKLIGGQRARYHN